MNKESRRLLHKAIGHCIANIEVVIINGIKQVIFDLVNKKQKLYSLVLYLQPDGLISRVVSSNKRTVTKIFTEYTGLVIIDVLTEHEYVLVCTSSIYLHINLNKGELKNIANQEGQEMHDSFRITKHGFE